MQPKTKLLLLVSFIILVVLFACKKQDQLKPKTESFSNIDWNTISFPDLPVMDFDSNETVDSDLYGKEITIEADEPIKLELPSKHLRLVAPY